MAKMTKQDLDQFMRENPDNPAVELINEQMRGDTDDSVKCSRSSELRTYSKSEEAVRNMNLDELVASQGGYIKYSPKAKKEIKAQLTKLAKDRAMRVIKTPTLVKGRSDYSFTVLDWYSWQYGYDFYGDHEKEPLWNKLKKWISKK